MCDTKYVGRNSGFVFLAIPSFPEQAGCREINLQGPWYKKGFAENALKGLHQWRDHILHPSGNHNASGVNRTGMARGRIQCLFFPQPSEWLTWQICKAGRTACSNCDMQLFNSLWAWKKIQQKNSLPVPGISTSSGMITADQGTYFHWRWRVLVFLKVWMKLM